MYGTADRETVKEKRKILPFSSSCHYDNKSHHPIRQLLESTACVKTRVYILSLEQKMMA